MTNPPTEMPAIVFQRRRDIELEAGFILAGQLIVDIPKGTKLKGKQQHRIENIVRLLTTDVQSGRMADDDALVIGWHGAAKLARQGLARPANAVDISNDEIMGAWAARSVVIKLRIDPRRPHRDGPRLDSDVQLQMGLLKYDA